MVEVRGRRVLLRDPRPEDVEARLRWTTVETEWQYWDGPWYGEEITPPDGLEQARRRLLAEIETPPAVPRKRLWIERIGGPLLGWVNQYQYDPEARVIYVGICICESAYWNQGLGTEALLLGIDHLVKELDLTCVRTATWSGNKRMIRCAEKCGFALVERLVGVREWQGRKYDGLEFRLTREEWDARGERERS